MGRTIPTFDPTAPLDALLDALDLEGVAAVSGLISPDLVKRIDADLEPHVQAERRRLANHGHATQTVRIGAVLAKSSNVVPILQSELIHAVCRRFLLPNCSCYQLSSIQLIEVPPHGPAGKIHRDDVIWPMPGKRPILVINFLIPLTRFTSANGATCVIPGSHRWKRDSQKVGPGRLDLDVVGDVDRSELVSTALEIGSVLPVLGGALHCSGENETDQPRRALSISVNLGWLRQEENSYLSVPREILDELPEAMQEFVGYQIYRPYLGYASFD